MSNITVRKEGGGQVSAAPLATEWDPFRQLRELMRWDPFQEMGRLAPIGRSYAFTPAFEVKENHHSFLFKADLPGVKEQDLEITVTGDRLNVSGKREAEQEEKSETYYTYERSFGSFMRSFSLPEGANGAQARAELKDGVLTVVVPKRPEVQAKKIAITAPEKGKA